jgi:hypothetical protein
MEFKSIVSGSKQLFNEKVNEGFKPFGSMSIVDGGSGLSFAIAMVKEEPSVRTHL